MVRNFNTFKAGHWYIYTGTERCGRWNDNGQMNFILDHKPVKCESFGMSSDVAQFEGGLSYWIWTDGFDNWIEIRDPKDNSPISSNGYLYSIKDNNLISIPAPSSAPFRSYYVLTRPPYSQSDLKKEPEIESIDGFKVGDKVKLRTEAEMIGILGYQKTIYGRLSSEDTDANLTIGMLKFLDHEVTIKEFIHNDKSYNMRIEEDDNLWHISWIVPKLVGQQRFKNRKDIPNCISFDITKDFIKQYRNPYHSNHFHKKNKYRNYKGEF